MSDFIHEKLNKHDENISLLQREQARLNARMQALEARIDRNQVTLIESLTRIEAKTDSTTEWMYESKGGLRLGKWISGLSLTVAALVISWIKFFKN